MHHMELRFVTMYAHDKYGDLRDCARQVPRQGRAKLSLSYESVSGKRRVQVHLHLGALYSTIYTFFNFFLYCGAVELWGI
jgi:hypothetical protein